MGVDRTRRVAVGVPVQRVVSVAGHVDALGSVAWVVVDRFGERPARVDVGDVADRPEDAARARVVAV